MSEVRALFADPEAVFVEGDHGTWIVSGAATNRLRDIVVTADGIDAVQNELSTRSEDAVVAFVSSAERGGRVGAFRSATSSRDLFYLQSSDGALVLTDHFRNAVNQLAVEDREVDRTALVDHLLFRSPLEPRTYVSGVRRLGRGECVHWNGETDDWERRVVDTLETVDRYDPATAVDELDDALAHVIRTDARPSARTMLSGGVASTLLASYRRDAPSPVQLTVDAPGYESEVAAGRDAADALDVSRSVVPVSESSFLEHLEATVDALGLPPRYNQTVVTEAGFETLEAGQYVNGQGAGSLFGLPGVKAARIANRLGRLLDAGVVERVSAAAGGRVATSHDALVARRRQLDRPLSNPGSFAQVVGTDSNADAVADVFETGVVRDRARRRMETATDRLPIDDSSAFAKQASAGHLVEYSRNDAVNQWRQLGYARNQTVVAPFRTRSVAQTALAVPADQRYVQRFRDAPPITTKYIPKDLLSRRLPDYQVDRPKRNGSLPIQRYVADGPLSTAFDRYEPPVFLSPESYDRHVDSYGSLTWELLTYSVWRDRILLDADLEPVPGTQRRYLRLPREPAPPST